MTHHIFFSWQSDTPNGVGRSLIETYLERAIGTLQADADIDLADRDIAIDRDTLDVPGSPPIMETIFGKIDRAAVFLSDLTYVAERPGGGRTPNPNVCIEHGWALKALTWRRVIAVMNTAMGHPDKHELPFDVRHTRRPIFFDCPQDADADTRRRARDALTKHLVIALRAIFGDKATQVGPPDTPAEPHPHDVELLAQFHRQLPVALRRFLHQHSFGAPFPLATLEPIHEMNADWIGAAYEFHDPPLQANFSALRKIATDFGSLVLERIYPMDANLKMGWPKTDLDVSQGMQPSTVAVVREINEKATELSAAIDSFDRLARDRVRTAIGLTGPAGPDPRRAQADAALGTLAFDAHRGLLPEIVAKPRVTLRLAPFAADEGSRLDPRQVAQMQRRFSPSVEAPVETNRDGRQWWSSAPPRQRQRGLNPETTWRMRLVRPGHLEYQATIGERIDDDPDILVDGRRLEALIVRTLERMGGIAEGLGLGGPALVSIVLEAEDVQLAQSQPGGRRIRQPEVILPVAVLQDVALPLAPAIQEQLDILWLTAGWPSGSPSYDSGAWAGYADDRTYDSI
ncbi:hypothetical protein [Agrobacterium tumefaciens]|uniref:hypothetical protein n=1 Tax=Agrobacterium tumefaciens TaxID=358 RepID=UPI00157180AA|nr:hypothetical protein [Agrobacterium tumefaciens]WCK21764.1 hypothetical protein G6M09_022525 [Agrobacterium tumefaciens]